MFFADFIPVNTVELCLSGCPLMRAIEKYQFNANVTFRAEEDIKDKFSERNVIAKNR